MTEQQQPLAQDPNIQLLSDGPHEMKFNDGIGVIENFMSPQYCKTLIDAFEFYNQQKFVRKKVIGDTFDLATTDVGVNQFSNGKMGRSDEQLYLEVADSGLAARTTMVVGEGFEHYANEYKGIIDSSDPIASWTVKLQKTEAGGGYHIWHCEDGSFIYRDRVLTWMIYLNDIPLENGGSTDFLHQKCSFHPTQGTAVYWPAAYTHMHRGSFLTGDTPKYIATGWFLREPGNVTDRIVQQKLGTAPPKRSKLNE